MENHFFVVQAEFKTGHVLKKDLSLFISGGDLHEVHEIFNSKSEAIDYAKKMQRENSEIEYWVKDSSDKTIFYTSIKETINYE